MATVTHEAVSTFCIWTKTGRRPTRFHATREAAIAEAERLAQVAPGKKFIVMQMVDKVSASEAEQPA